MVRMKASEKDNRKLNMRITLVIWCILCGISMAGMLVVASDKTIVIEDAAQKQEALPSDSLQAGAVWGAMLEPEEDSSYDRQLCIPIEEGTKAEQVIVENKYMERELWIYIKKAEEEFYQQNNITGDCTPIKKCWYEVQEDGLLLKMRMDTVWEYHSTMEGNNLKIAFSNPHENYKQLVVLDPVGEDALQVAKLVQKKLEQPEIKLYITGNEDADTSLESSLALVQAVEPDLFLQIGVSENEQDVTQYGIQSYYNDEYYIPEFGNVEWADVVTKKVTSAAINRALGLFPVSEDNILKLLDMPAAAISVGFVTNEQERLLLKQESYREKLAEGIAEAILEVYTNAYQQK